MAGAIPPQLDRSVLVVETADGVCLFHRVTGEYFRLSPAGVAFLRALDQTNPVAHFGYALGLSGERGRAAFLKIHDQLARRGVFRPLPHSGGGGV